jgi:large subunit ribosomal protein L21
MIAVIRTGGKQYLVSPGQKIKIEKIKGKKEGQEIVFEEVLLLEKNKKLEIGEPFLEGVKVIGKILKEGKSKKVVVFKYKSKTRYKVKKGHRQPFLEVEIIKIESRS